MNFSAEIIPFAPLIVALVYFLLQAKIVVTPAQLEEKHSRIINEVSEHFVTKDSYNELRDDFGYIKEKIDKIYEMITMS